MNNAPTHEISINEHFFSETDASARLKELVKQLPESRHKEFNNLHFFKLWQQEFLKYQDSHVMAPLREKLLEGLDDTSREYIELHERLLGLCRFGAESILSTTDMLWTAKDIQIYEDYLQRKKDNNPSFLNSVDVAWGTVFTNGYGLDELPEHVKKQINGKAIIDVGAYNGDTGMMWRDRFPDSVCYCFEPDLNNFKYLSMVLRSEIKKGYIKPFNQALGDKKDIMRLSKAQSSLLLNESASLVYQYSYKEEELQQVQINTVDDLVAENRLEVGLIKMDVEGFEPKVIVGALNTIKTQCPVLAVAIYHSPEEFYEVKPYLESLGLNYRFQVRRSNFFREMYENSAPSLYEMILIAYPG